QFIVILHESLLGIDLWGLELCITTSAPAWEPRAGAPAKPRKAKDLERAASEAFSIGERSLGETSIFMPPFRSWVPLT
ncbi:hypothetical protein, partial [Azotobacter vinelandii]